MTKRFFEDFSAGEVMELPGRQVSRAEIIAFAAEYDPQPFHLDEDAARVSLLGGLSASGWHSCCLLMRIISDHRPVLRKSGGSRPCGRGTRSACARP